MVLWDCDNREMLLRNLCAASLAIFKELARKNVLERWEHSKHGRKRIEKSYLALQSIVSEKSAFHEDVLYANAVLDESERDSDELPASIQERFHSRLSCRLVQHSAELCTDNGHNEVV